MRDTTAKKIFMVAVLAAAAGLAGTVQALDVNLTEDLAYVEVEHDGKNVRVQRIQDQDNVLKDGFVKTSRQCPPFCIQPMTVAPGVTTIGEAEVFRFMDRELESGKGMIIDARTPSWYNKGTIPGSVNIPFTVFEKDADDPELVKTLERLGGKRRGDVNDMVRNVESFLARLDMFDAGSKTADWDFSNARELVLWCNGPWCGQSPHAIRALLAHGYPAKKIRYYRGGMQMWKVLGLTVVVPGSAEQAVVMK